MDLVSECVHETPTRVSMRWPHTACVREAACLPLLRAGHLSRAPPSTVRLPISARIIFHQTVPLLPFHFSENVTHGKQTGQKLKCVHMEKMLRWITDIVLEWVKSPGFVTSLLWDRGQVSLYLCDLISTSVKWGWCYLSCRVVKV